jgi:hypothetical protein
MSIYPIMFGDSHCVYVAFDCQEAQRFAKAENDEVQCEIYFVEELPLIDNYGFPCARKDAGFLFPWLKVVKDEQFKHYAPEAWARYVAMMSKDS